MLQVVLHVEVPSDMSTNPYSLQWLLNGLPVALPTARSRTLVLDEASEKSSGAVGIIIPRVTAFPDWFIIPCDTFAVTSTHSMLPSETSVFGIIYKN